MHTSPPYGGSFENVSPGQSVGGSPVKVATKLFVWLYPDRGLMLAREWQPVSVPEKNALFSPPKVGPDHRQISPCGQSDWLADAAGTSVTDALVVIPSATIALRNRFLILSAEIFVVFINVFSLYRLNI